MEGRPLEPITAKLIVDIISAILPFGEIAKAWGKYYEYRAKRTEVEYKLKELKLKAPLVLEHIRASVTIEMERLKNERLAFDRRIAIVEAQLRETSLTQAQVSAMLDVLKDRLRTAVGDDLRHLAEAIHAVTSHMTAREVSVLSLLGKEVDLQARSMEHGRSALPRKGDGRPLLEDGS